MVKSFEHPENLEGYTPGEPYTPNDGGTKVLSGWGKALFGKKLAVACERHFTWGVAHGIQTASPPIAEYDNLYAVPDDIAVRVLRSQTRAVTSYRQTRR